jgi:hypothetical protein
MPIYFLIYLVYLQALYLSCALTGCFLLRRNWPLSYKLLVALSCVTLVVELVAMCWALWHINYTGLYNAWAYVEVGAIIYIQLREVVHAWAKRLLIFLLVLLSVTAVGLYLLLPAFPRLNGHFLLFFLFIQLIAACAVLVDILQGTSDSRLSVQPAVWLATGMLFYSSIFLVLHIWGFFLPNEANKYFGIFSSAANTCMYGGFIAAFITLRRRESIALRPHSFIPPASSSPDWPSPPA